MRPIRLVIWLVATAAVGVVLVTLVRRWRRTSHTQVHRVTATRP